MRRRVCLCVDPPRPSPSMRTTTLVCENGKKPTLRHLVRTQRATSTVIPHAPEQAVIRSPVGADRPTVVWTSGLLIKMDKKAAKGA